MNRVLQKTKVILTTALLFFSVSYSCIGQQPDSVDNNVLLLLSHSDLYCSFFIWEENISKIKIVGMAVDGMRTLLKDGDEVYLSGGKAQGVDVDQVYQIVEVGPQISNFGRLSFKRGEARIFHADENKSVARLENICGIAKTGNLLIPFIEKETKRGKDLGYDFFLDESKSIFGHFLYFQNNLNQISLGHYALVDFGEQDGIKVGDQLLACRKIAKDSFMRSFSNMVVIDVQSKTSTVKIISGKDRITINDLVTFHPKIKSSIH